MSNYTQSTNFATKDALSPGDPLKIVRGTEINTEFTNIAVAVATKLDTTGLASPGPIGATTPSSFNGTTGTFSGAVSGTTGTFSGNVQMASLNGGQLAGLRNKIINGNMGIFQRGTTAVTTTNVYGPADRWENDGIGDTFSTSQGAFVSGDTLYDTGGAQFYTQIAVTSVAGANNYYKLQQPIEDVRILAGQTVTVSFWAKAASGTPSIALELYQFFGTGGSPSAAVPGIGQAQALTTTWTKYSKTFAIPSLAGITLGTTANTSYTVLGFWIDAGTSFSGVGGRAAGIGTQVSKTVSIAQVQLEVGPVATPFEQRPIGMELALCQRYFETIRYQTSSVISVCQATSTTAASGFGTNFAVTKISTPALTYGTGSANALTATGSNAGGTILASAPSVNNFNWSVTSASGLVAGNAVIINCASTLILQASAEL